METASRILPSDYTVNVDIKQPCVTDWEDIKGIQLIVSSVSTLQDVSTMYSNHQFSVCEMKNLMSDK